MRNILTAILLLFSVAAYASEDTIDGHDYLSTEVVQWAGMAAPSVSSAGWSRTYHDSTSNTLKLSSNGGAYADILTTTSGGALYLKLDGTNADDATGDFEFFKNTTYAAGSDSNSLWVIRNTTNSRWYIDQYTNTWFVTDGALILNSGSDGSGNIAVIDPFEIGADYLGSGVNLAMRHFGWITGATNEKYVQWQLSDVDDKYHLTREDTNVVGTAIDMPLYTYNDGGGIYGTNCATQYLVNNAKLELIEDVNQIVGTSDIKGFWIFDQTGATTSVTDRSPNARTLTLSANASTLSPVVTGLCPNLTFVKDGANWYVADNADFTAGTAGFTVIWLVNPTDITYCAVSKVATNQSEWTMVFDNSDQLQFGIYGALDGTIYKFRYYATALTSDQGAFHVYAGSCSGTAAYTLKCYRDGVQVDDNGYSAGVMAGTVNGTANITNYNFFNSGSASSKDGAFIYVSKELTAAEVKRISDRLRAFSGVFI